MFSYWLLGWRSVGCRQDVEECWSCRCRNVPSFLNIEEQRWSCVSLPTWTHKSNYILQHNKWWKIKVDLFIWNKSLFSDFLNEFSVCEFRWNQLVFVWLPCKLSHLSTEEQRGWFLSAADDFDTHHPKQNQASGATSSCSDDSLPEGGSIVLWSVRRLIGERSQPQTVWPVLKINVWTKTHAAVLSEEEQKIKVYFLKKRTD